jgi:hypothetical protein
MQRAGGDLVFVQKAAIHRELNTATDKHVALVLRIASGERVFNVHSPASAE